MTDQIDTPPSPHDPSHPLAADDLKAQFEQLNGHLVLRLRTAEPKSFRFQGNLGKYSHFDDLGLEWALSYGIYNPLAVKAYLAITGGSATEADGALAIPAESALILPIAVHGQLRIGVDAGELGENTGTLWRLKFAHPQPFFLGGA